MIIVQHFFKNAKSLALIPLLFFVTSCAQSRPLGHHEGFFTGSARSASGLAYDFHESASNDAKVVSESLAELEEIVEELKSIAEYSELRLEDCQLIAKQQRVNVKK